MKFFKSAAVFILLVVKLALPFAAAGHGFAGARFFPEHSRPMIHS